MHELIHINGLLPLSKYIVCPIRFGREGMFMGSINQGLAFGGSQETGLLRCGTLLLEYSPPSLRLGCPSRSGYIIRLGGLWELETFLDGATVTNVLALSMGFVFFNIFFDNISLMITFYPFIMMGF